MKTLIQGLLFFTAILSLSSCFEILEEVELNADGSGSFAYTVNASQSKSKLSQVMRMDSINGYKVPDTQDIKKPMQALVEHASRIAGISQVVTQEDFENYIFSFSCDFKDIDALNELVAELRKTTKDNRTDVPHDHFSYNPKTKSYTRNGGYSIKSEFKKMKDVDKVIFDGATFTSIFRSDQELSSFSNQAAKISPNKKALMLRIPVLDLVHESANMGNTIQLKP